ncbi:MAG: hypothetical protein KAS19_02085, partial [Anaerolineales bacterium]|nr:hypothetical protein [Anaerolineales bacterium]
MDCGDRQRKWSLRPRNCAYHLHPRCFRSVVEVRGHPLVDNFGTFKRPSVSDLQELVIGSRV